MLCHGFYESQEELLAVASPVTTILNGSNDIVKTGSSSTLGVKRYFESTENNLVVNIKCIACDILLQIS